MTLVTK